VKDAIEDGVNEDEVTLRSVLSLARDFVEYLPPK